MSGLDCKSCEAKLHLEYRDKVISLKSGKQYGFANAPLLVCGKCGKRYVPMATDFLIKEVCKMDKEVVEVDEQTTCTVAETNENAITWFDFEKIKNTFLEQRFISEKVKFLYDKDDYYFIPGLVREWKVGFLTPVFFNIEVLLKYMHHPDYGLDIGADTFGYIYKGDEHYITFGINENNKVIMWLGDIGNMPLEEQFYLRSENVLSDHSIGSEFYEAEIEVVWANPSAENNLLKKRLEFNESIRLHFGLSVAQLDTETVRIAKNIRKLLIDTNDAFKDLMIPMNELLVESINNKEIKKDLKKRFPELKEELKEKKGIKLLQLWLDKNTQNIDVNLEIAPLYVLYDLRLVSAHLYSDDSREELLTKCCERLGLDLSERNHIIIANTLVVKLTSMYEKFKTAISVLDEEGKTDE